MIKLLLGGFLGLELLFDLFNIDSFGHRLESLELERLPSAGRFCSILAVFALHSGN